MQDFDKALSEMKNTLPSECISLDREELMSHGYSTWTYHDPRILPGAVLFPRNTEDVSGSKAVESRPPCLKEHELTKASPSPYTTYFRAYTYSQVVEIMKVRLGF